MKNKFENIDNLKEQISSFDNDDFALYWLTDRILVQKAGDDMPAEDSILELRIFNENKELFAKKTKNEWRYRIKDDQLENNNEFVITESVVRGVIAKEVKKILSKSKEDNAIIAIKKHDYIDYNEVGAAGYVDSRFVSFVIKN